MTIMIRFFTHRVNNAVLEIPVAFVYILSCEVCFGMYFKSFDYIAVCSLFGPAVFSRFGLEDRINAFRTLFLLCIASPYGFYLVQHVTPL